MRISVELEDELAEELKEVALRTKTKPSAVLQQAVRAGLPMVANGTGPPRPEGYFASAYANPDPERLKLKAAMTKVKQRPKR